MSKAQPPHNQEDTSPTPTDEIEQLRLGWQRCQADFENYRKRTERERGELWQMASLETLLKLTPIADNFRRAFTDTTADTTAWRNGIEQIQKQVDELLESSDLVRLDVVGTPFDPSQHEALSQLPHETIPEGHVTQEVEAGYRYRDTIVKHAKVVVSTGQPA